MKRIKEKILFTRITLSFNLKQLIEPQFKDFGWYPYGLFNDPTILSCSDINIESTNSYGKTTDNKIQDGAEAKELCMKYWAIILNNLTFTGKRIKQKVVIKIYDDFIPTFSKSNTDDFVFIEPLPGIGAYREKAYITIYSSGDKDNFSGEIYLIYPLSKIINPNEFDTCEAEYGLPIISSYDNGEMWSYNLDSGERIQRSCSIDEMRDIVTQYFDTILLRIFLNCEEWGSLYPFANIDVNELENTTEDEDEDIEKYVEEDFNDRNVWSNEEFNEYYGYDRDYDGDYD